MDQQEKIANLPLVSIITGYYNRLENLEESVRSILGQSYKNFEYIIFDDCSTDGTREALEKFNDPRLKLIKHTNNIGFTKGMIQAVSESKGNYIAVHGAGDISLSTRIEKQLRLLENNQNIGIVGCNIKDISNDGEIIRKPGDTKSKHSFTAGEVMFRRDLYFRAGGYNSHFYYGQFTPLKLGILKFSQPGYVNELLYHRIHFKKGVSKNKSKIIKQKIFVALGQTINEKGIIETDISGIVIEVSLRYPDILKINSEDERRFLSHSRKNFKVAYFTYILFKKGLVPKVILQYLAAILKKKRQ